MFVYFVGRTRRQLPVETLTAFFAVVTPHEVDHLVSKHLIYNIT